MTTSYDMHTAILMDADAEVRDADETRLAALLRWGAYVLSERVNVKSYFAELKRRDDVTLYWSAATWQARTSEAIKVLRFYGAEAASFATALSTIHDLNDERVENDERESWSLQFWAAQAGMVKPRKASRVRTIDQGSVVSFVEACDDAATLSALAELVAVKLAELSAKPTVDRVAALAVAA